MSSMSVKWIEDKSYYRVVLKDIKHFIKFVGLLGTKSDSKFIPKDYLYSDHATRTKLLQGLLDTDGHINKRGHFEFSTISESLKDDFTELVRGLGYSTNYSINKSRSGGYSNTPVHRITQTKGYKHGLKIVDIVKTGKREPVKCLKVSNTDSLYITDNYVVTHNTTTTTVLAQAMINQGLSHIENYDSFFSKLFGKRPVNPMDLKKVT